MTYQRPSHLGTRAGAPLRWAASLAFFLVASAHPAQGAGVVGTGTPESCTEAALDTALAGGGLVTFDCGPDPVTITITSTKTIAADTTIDGGGLITISGGNSVGVFSVNAGVTFTVQNVTIANGYRYLVGGGIDNSGTLTVTNSTFSGNFSQAHADTGHGGAISNVGTLTVANSTFSGNSTSGNLAAAIGNAGTLTVTNSIFSGNSGSSAIANVDFNLNVPTVTVTNSTFSGNTASGSGGAILNILGTLTVANSTFSDNSADNGGAAIANGFPAVLPGGTLTVTNSTFSGNSATGDGGEGGAIVNVGTLNLTNSTFSGNSATGSAGAIVNTAACGDTRNAPCPATLTNTIIANSTQGGNCAGTITDGGHNLDSDGTCGVGPPTDPLLDPAGLADNGGPTQTIALLPDSPAIDAGDAEVCANPPVNGLDQRGYVRPGIGHTQCSIGAYEADAVPPGPCTGDCDGGGTVAVSELVALVNIDLGSAPISACPNGIPGSDAVTIALIIRAVNNALDGCPRPPDPTQPGPFGIGVRQITFTKPSETRPGEDRVLLTDIWYPTTPDAAPLDVDLGGVINAPWAPGAVNLPLLLFSHGNCSLPTLSRFFMRALASYGFIVAAPLHPGDLLTDPDCATADNFDLLVNRPADVRFVIDSLLQLNTDPTSFFSGAINPNRIGMSGHSYGGYTTLQVTANDPRVIAGLAQAPGAPGPIIVGATIHHPMMVQGGALDSLTPFDTRARPIYDDLNPPKYLVEILHTGHTAFFDDGCYPNGVYPALPTPFCDAAGPDALTADAAHQFILRYAVPFLLHWVAGNDRFDAFLAPGAAPAGVVFTADIGGE